MGNFFQNIIDKITGHGSNAPKINISTVATAAAGAADPAVQAAQEAAMKAEVEKQVAAQQQQIGTGGYSPQSSEDITAALNEIHEASLKAAQEVADAADQFEIIKEHTLTYDDTLSALALHFYGHATPEYWGLIILANKNNIGDKVKDYTPGKVIKIPKLPEDMKK